MSLFSLILVENKITYFPEYIQYSSDINSNPVPIKNNGQNIAIDSNLDLEMTFFFKYDTQKNWRKVNINWH